MLSNDRLLRAWAIEQADGDIDKARVIERFVKDDGGNREAPAAIAAE
jgi:hypothetical protein